MTGECREQCPIDSGHGCGLVEEHDTNLHYCPTCKVKWPDGPVLW